MEIKNQNLSKLTFKNSLFSLSSTFISKVGGLIFTLIIARILLPDLFGIYALTLSVVSIAITFADMGIGLSSVRYVSDAFGKKDNMKARSYFRYFLKIKLFLIFSVIFFVLITAKFFSYNVFNKPLIFIPLIFSSLYILVESLRSFLMGVFMSLNDLKPVPFFGLIHESSKILFSVLAVLLLVDHLKITGIFIAFGFSGILTLTILLLFLIKKEKNLFFGKKENIDRKRVRRYMGFMSVASLSLVFFGSIDILMLGRFVENSYIGYYRAALGIVLAFSALLAVSGILLPVFTQISKSRIQRGFKRTLRYLFMFSIPLFFGLLILSKYIIVTIYGSEYLLASSSLSILAILVVTAPLITLYSTIFSAKENAKDLSKAIFTSLILNIFLNYVLIKILLNWSQEYVIMGVAFATVVSRGFLLVYLSYKANNYLNISLRNSSFSKFLLASLVMAFFLISFNLFVSMNFLWGILGVILSVGVYFSTLFILKEIRKEDLDLLKIFLNR